MRDKEAMQAARDKFIAKETALTDYPKVITTADKALIKGFEAGYLAAKNEWVPITHRFPEKCGMYLTTSPDIDTGELDVDINWFDLNEGIESLWRKNVIAWRELPPPYDEQNGGKDE